MIVSADSVVPGACNSLWLPLVASSYVMWLHERALNEVDVCAAAVCG